MWTDWELPKKVIINEIEINMRTDYRVILEIFQVLNDEELLDQEKIYVALEIFYEDFNKITDYTEAVKIMYLFINGNKEEEENNTNERPLIDWSKDIRIIIPPVNKIIGKEVRSLEYMHWWTFLSAFMEIGECTFSTFVSIRNKKSKGKKLDASEKEIYKENKDRIDIKTKADKLLEEQILAMMRGD